MDSQRADKKQKLNVSNDDFCVHQLPDAALTRAAAFLDINDRVLFAMALPTWRESQTHDISKAIVGAELVECINLGENIPPKLLTDFDLHHILVCVDAVTTLKSLNLSYGHGREPLRGSNQLWAIDLSLMVRYELPKVDLECSLSMDAAIPILESIQPLLITTYSVPEEVAS